MIAITASGGNLGHNVHAEVEPGSWVFPSILILNALLKIGKENYKLRFWLMFPGSYRAKQGSNPA